MFFLVFCLWRFCWKCFLNEYVFVNEELCIEGGFGVF